MNLPFTILVFSLVLVTALGGCQNSSDTPEFPPQTFATTLQTLGKDTGELRGRIKFPSNYNQRSTAFFIDNVEFVTYPDGRFWIKSIPSGPHILKVLTKGYEPLIRKIEIAQDSRELPNPLQLVEARGIVTGRVVNGNGASAGNVPLSLSPNSLSTNTQIDGSFQFIGVGAGKYTLAITSGEFKKHVHII